ncbi:Calcineurin-like phosphoesterase superfamily protein [Paenibacillus tianmuensis]|uniref:Calcineurin-like phosphoesterase superfamily protein n=1 Tax=Paenibacillus tianmuensis TaxID=624147 RepID=A0A1G4TIC9_9BACL|nr:metallophosphoesterase [Paenibacillus tianmuensis]SCW80339.1 Calcineurin-like phosphoesterase superfamily protein [Paenibacillus tianmuensis]
MIYFTADLHFEHEKIMKHTHRPFRNLEEMHRKLIQKWNQKVSYTDEVYILGDVTMKGGMVANHYLTQLNGTKYLIKGNHDNFVDDEPFDQSHFVWIKDYFELKHGNHHFILFHYPILEWHKQRHGSIQLHGHIHSNISYNLEMLEQGIKRYDVGVDANLYAPVSMEEILKTLEG